ncbi:class I SAM-dependent methyltransferase [Thermococcus thioreducens]|uniref:Methyltransferase domain-containing protein n=1 Tax=Thermococcus thioreducens TaxID=277988 RepID=A0A0Q2M3R7_9EURY|nr:class I SAM-dependent methyltransferase [Thermococcus thioreducens]ASJ11669.1 SAM-dependent methyltransferase [Thermococcus thioreducens]KQH82594.1 SAM-dependent methyltransferase [Thermococcus thioreducens]SEW15885.1 Methyltransferase domain-containing protein [Thermococcus thioreducens]
MSLEELYRYARGYMEPGNEGARKRFMELSEFFEKLKLPRGGRILDLCAGTGIAGSAAAKATNAKKLTLLDLRAEDLERVREWLEFAGLGIVPTKVRGDVREAAELIEEHEVALLFGNTMIHFDPFDAVRIFANVALTLTEDGVFIVEDTDRVYRILYSIGYKEFFVESKGENHTLASVHEGYDVRRGTFKRAYYLLPGFRKVGEFDFHHWDLATQLAIGRIFFGEARLIRPGEHGFTRVGDVLYFKHPRKDVAELVLSDFSAPL